MNNNIIMQIRQKHGITQEELAHVLNVSYTSVNAWESGKRNPQERMQKVLTELLEADALSDYTKGSVKANTGLRRTDAGFVSTIIDYGNHRDPYPLTHGIGRWYGSLPSFLVSNLLSFLATDLGNTGNALVNFCGSGTVPLELSIIGRQCYSVDANPVAVLLSRVKTTPLNSETLNLLRIEADNIFSANGKWADVKMLSDDNLLKEESKWIPTDVREFTLSVIEGIKGIQVESVKNVLAVTLASILPDFCCIDKRCTNHYVYKNPQPFSREVFINGFRREIENFIQKNLELSAVKNYKVPQIDRGNACKLDHKENSMSLVFSHPPYGTTINYYAISRIPHSIVEAVNLMPNENPSESDTFSSCRNCDLSSGTLARFSSFTCEWISEAFRVLKPGGILAVIIGDSRNNGTLSHPFTNIISVGEQIGFITKEIFIWVTNHKAGMHVKRKGNHIDHNYVIILEKKQL